MAYYATAGFESAGGRALADQLVEAIDRAELLPQAEASGMRLPVLRETRMTAVVCSLGPVQRVVDAAPIISDAVLEALSTWVAPPYHSPLTRNSPG